MGCEHIEENVVHNDPVVAKRWKMTTDRVTMAIQTIDRLEIVVIYGTSKLRTCVCSQFCRFCSQNVPSKRAS